MDNEQNPLINFTPRAQDNGETIGGGGGEDTTKWLLSGAELVERSTQLVADIDRVSAEWDSVSVEGLPHVLKATSIEKAQAKTHQVQIVSMFTVGENTGQVGFIGEHSLMLKIDSKAKLETIRANFSDYDKNVHSISALTNIELFKPQVTESDNQSDYKLIPLTYGDPATDQLAIQVIQRRLSDQHISNELIAYTDSLRIIKIPTITPDSLKFIRTLPIRAVEPIEKVALPFRFLNNLSTDDFPIQDFDPKVKYPLIGLLDSGVSTNPLTQGWVTRGDGVSYSDDELDTSHGTYIATLLIHGETFANIDDASIKGCRIVDVPIIPKLGANETELIQNIRRAIQANPNVRIWNLSVSLTSEISSSEFSVFASALDQIQHANNVLICKSAGNDPTFMDHKSAGKLSTGAESIRAITVGSMNRNADQFGYALENHPALYSRHGPAPASVVKPDVTHFGGDLFATKTDATTLADFEQVSDTASTDGKHLTHMVGTSFSAPKVAKNLAEIDLLTTEKYTLLTLKALEIHSASYLETPALDPETRLAFLGYGKPANASKTIFSSSYSSTLILQGKLQKGQHIDIMDFPYPKALIKDGHYTGRIKITLVYDPILMQNQGAEYCQSNLEVKFGTYDEKRDTVDYLSHFNPVKRVGSFNTLLESQYGKKQIAKNPEYAGERTLIQYGQKYHPVKKYAFDLSEITPGKFNNVSGDRHWFLFLEGHYRDYAEKDALRHQEVLSIPYSLIITIEDPDEQAQVYDSTVQELDANNFIHSNVSVDNSIHLSN
ncbi:S8 family peptidase [Lacticaseibacillus rhamnosus]|uniref:S8 family peptidase n=1 Tax=Lacticaseibacillus rhamnosus TaxID=47715 RepID=UPI0007E0322F|nr:S8 family peptidase [Lacticaseibacillus rhamnosus]OAU79679.1 subtilase [Lacticaseibacillus rhamnosus]